MRPIHNYVISVLQVTIIEIPERVTIVERSVNQKSVQHLLRETQIMKYRLLGIRSSHSQIWLTPSFSFSQACSFVLPPRLPFTHPIFKLLSLLRLLILSTYAGFLYVPLGEANLSYWL
jgi:hypothetical protein